jgi:1L-myo-inositol 1-phosphate cytidylyltransferase
MIKQGVILASGLGSRLNSEGRNEPKPLMPVGGMALIERVITLMQSAGIEHIVVVLGYRSDQMIDFFKRRKFSGIDTVINDEYNKKNGISLLRSREKLSQEPFVLSMADHIFSNDFFAEFIEKAEPELEKADVLLSVDRDIEGVFDLDDATKVFTEGNLITKIAKDLGGYNAIDTGLFLCNHKIFDKLDGIYKRTGDVSISEGMKSLADERRFGAVDMTGHLWQDVDTPSMKNEAEERLIDVFIKNEPCSDFFSNNFFYKAAHETALALFKKEHFDWRIIDTLFFISAVFVSIISVKLEIAFPSIFTVFGSTLLYYLNRLKNSVKPSAEEQSGFSLFSYGVNMVISMMPVVLGANFIAGLIILILMAATVSSRVTGLHAVIRAQVPELHEEMSAKYLSPSFFALIYAVLVILPVPFIVTAAAGAIFLVFSESRPEGKEK